MKNPFTGPAEGIYRRFGTRAGRNRRVYGALSRLYPMEDTQKLYRSFQVKRLAAALAVVISGAVSALLMCLCSRTEGKLAEGAQLIRNEWSAGDYRVTLQARTGEWSREITFLVRERKLSEEERAELLVRLQRELPERIRGENEDLEHVKGNLELVTSLEGYPFRLAWSSADNGRIDRSGRVDRRGLAPEGESVDLTVRISGQGESVSLSYEIFLIPETLGQEEEFYRELEQELDRLDGEQKSQVRVTLPESLRGQSVVWTERGQGRGQKGLLLLMLTALCCALVCGGMENDLERSCKKRDRELLADYPEFVSRLRLYLSAGLTVKSAFFRMTADYGQQGKGGKRCLYQEMKLSCHQLENGVAQEKVYQELGKRCGEMRYRRLGFLLSVHLKQGNEQLLALLSQEADSAQEDRRSMARKAGEEAGTKLLLPMMLMLVVVMFLVLLPACMDFGSV